MSNRESYRCIISKMLNNGKMMMTHEIRISFFEEALSIEANSEIIRFKYSKLEYIEHQQQLLGDGLKVTFNHVDPMTQKCIQKLERLIEEKRGLKKPTSKSSGPRNTLNFTRTVTPVKHYKKNPLELTIKSTSQPSPIEKQLDFDSLAPEKEITTPPTQAKTSEDLDRRNPISPDINNNWILRSLPQSKKSSPSTRDHSRFTLPPAMPTMISPWKATSYSFQMTPPSYETKKRVIEDLGDAVSPDRTPPKSSKYTYDSTSPQKKDWNRNHTIFDITGDTSTNNTQLQVKSSYPIQGIPNMGNTCFMAAIVQALCSLEQVVSDFSSKFWLSVAPPPSSSLSTSKSYTLRSSFTSDSSNSTHNLHSFLTLISAVRSSKTHATPTILDLKDSVTRSIKKYRGYSQHDAHEFLTDLISLLESEQLLSLKQKLSGTCYQTELQIPETESSEMKLNENNQKIANTNETFGLPPLSLAVIPTVRRLLSVVDMAIRCTNCNNLRHKKELYHDFSLLLSSTDNDTPFQSSLSSSPSSSTPSIQLESLISTFFSVDKRDLACEKCHFKEGQVEVTTKIEKFPDVMILQLKRFDYNLEKITTPVSFPFGLDMSPYCAETAIAPALNDDLLAKDLLTAFPLLSPISSNPNQNIQSTSNSQLNGDVGDDFLISSAILDSTKGFPSSQQNGPFSEVEWKAELSETPPSWSCSRCTYNNPMSYSRCDICQSYRYDDENRNSTDVPKLLQDQELSSPPSIIPSDQVDNPFYYHLVAVVRHVGSSAFSGHYTCDVMKKDVTHENFHWYRCDDYSISEISQTTVLSQRADPYILFYQRNTPPTPPPPPISK